MRSLHPTIKEGGKTTKLEASKSLIPLSAPAGCGSYARQGGDSDTLFNLPRRPERERKKIHAEPTVTISECAGREVVGPHSLKTARCNAPRKVRPRHRSSKEGSINLTRTQSPSRGEIEEGSPPSWSTELGGESRETVEEEFHRSGR